jgi:hypothetical protein
MSLKFSAYELEMVETNTTLNLLQIV